MASQRAVVFRTPGLIDIRAFTHFGVNSKPNSENPIGYFGTGLKYAIAVLCREGFRPIVWIGQTKYTFRVKGSRFRDKEFGFVVMIREDHSLTSMLKKREVQLPFTTELGKNWSLWQAFRELESNTRDEQGQTDILVVEAQGDKHYVPSNRLTTVIVEGEKFVQEYLDQEKTFLPEGLTQRGDSGTIQVFDRPSKHIYYRGLRVYDFPKDEHSELTYNLLKQLELTEDRTLKDPHMVRYDIKEWLATQASEEQVEKALKAPKKSLEGQTSWEYTYTKPSEAFIAASARAPGYADSARRYVSGYLPKARVEDPFKTHPRPWIVLGNKHILDAKEMPVDLGHLLMAMNIINQYDYNKLDHHVLKTIEADLHGQDSTSTLWRTYYEVLP